MSGRVLLVTGGGRGIGAEVCRQAVTAGYAVVVNYRDRATTAESLVAELEASGGRAVAVRADVSDADAVQRLYDTATQRLGPVSALVNNAGIVGSHGRLDELDTDTLRRVVDVNVTGALLCAREAVRRMSTRHGGSGGAIVNVSSRAAVLGSPGEWVHYAATKGAMDTLTIGLAAEVGREDVRVNAVAPGLIDTGLHAEAGVPDRLRRMADGIPLGRPGQPAEIAAAVLWLLSAEASYVTGAILATSGGR